MPLALKYIDKIAREMQRDVLFIDFINPLENQVFDYKSFKPRQELLFWLEKNNISYQECGPIAREDGWEAYHGQIYVDLPIDEDNAKFQLLDNHLMTSDNTFKIQGIEFYSISLELAMKNAHHDEEGFWEEWAEHF